MDPQNHEYHFLNQALDVFIAAVDAKAKLLPFPKGKFPADALVELVLNGHRELFVTEIRQSTVAWPSARSKCSCKHL
jgi:hypothetical protein